MLEDDVVKVQPRFACGLPLPRKGSSSRRVSTAGSECSDRSEVKDNAGGPYMQPPHAPGAAAGGHVRGSAAGSVGGGGMEDDGGSMVSASGLSTVSDLSRMSVSKRLSKKLSSLFRRNKVQVAP